MIRVWFNKTFSSIHSALELIREADKKGKYGLVCSSPNPYAIGPLAAHKAAVEPGGVTGAEYVDWCLSFCREEGVDILVPGKEASLLARCEKEFWSHGVRILSAAAPETLELLHDKARFYDTAQAPTAPAPEFAVFRNLRVFDEAYRQMKAEHDFLCMKPSVSVYGIGFRQIVEQQTAFSIMLGGDAYRVDLTSLRAMLKQAAEFRPMLLMPYLGGHEFSVDCVADNGTLVCGVARRKSRASGGGQLIVRREDIEAACEHLVAQFGLNGNVNIQFREGESGLHVLEINPRMSGGIGMACLAGPNLPYLALEVFDRGRGSVNIPLISEGLRVGESSRAVRLS